MIAINPAKKMPPCGSSDGQLAWVEHLPSTPRRVREDWRSRIKNLHLPICHALVLELEEPFLSGVMLELGLQSPWQLLKITTCEPQA
jgi:hypothetical protein